MPLILFFGILQMEVDFLMMLFKNVLKNELSSLAK